MPLKLNISVHNANEQQVNALKIIKLSFFPPLSRLYLSKWL